MEELGPDLHVLDRPPVFGLELGFTQHGPGDANPRLHQAHGAAHGVLATPYILGSEQPLHPRTPVRESRLDTLAALPARVLRRVERFRFGGPVSRVMIE